MPDPTQEIEYLPQEDYDTRLKGGVKNLISKGYNDDDIKLYIKGYKSRFAVQETTKPKKPPKKQPTTPRAKTDPRFNPDFSLSPNLALVKERQEILDEYENRPVMQVDNSDLDAKLADVEARIEASMTRKSNYRVGKEKIADIERQQNELEAKAYRLAKANNMDPIQILESDGTYQALQLQKQQEQDLIALDQAVLDKVKEDTNADTGTMAFVKRLGRTFGIQDDAEQILELDEKVEEEILLGLGGDLREKEKIANGFATLKNKEQLVTQAKVNVFKNERNKINRKLEDLAQSDAPANEKMEAFKAIQEESFELMGITGFDAAEQMIKHSFDKSKVSKDYNELFDGEGFLPESLDALGTFSEGLAQTAYKGTVGFVADVMSGAGDMFTDQDRYSIFDAFSDTVYNLGDFNLAPSSEAEGTRIVTEEGDFNINFKTATKSLSQTLPFTLMLINDVKKGKISSLEKSMGKLLNPTKSKKLTQDLTMLDSAFRYTYSDNLKQGQELGLDDNKARVFAGMLSTVEGMAQKIMPDANFLGTTAGKAIVNSFRGNLKNAATKKAIGEATKNFFGNIVKEIGEEEAVAFMNDLVKSSMVAGHTNSEFWDMKAQKELMAATVIMSGALGSAGARNDFRGNRQEFYNSVAENIEGIEAQFAAELNNPSISEEAKQELEEARGFANDIKNAIAQAPQKVTQEQIDVLVEKQRLMRENETLDKSLQADNQKRIAEIDEQLSGELQTDEGGSVIGDVVNRIRELFDFAIANKGKVKKEPIKSVTKQEGEKLSKLTGIEIDEGYNHIIDSSAINHILNRHGSPKVEEKRGQVAVTIQDFEKVPEIIEKYDSIEKGDLNRQGQQTILYTKTFDDGITYVVEEIRTGRKELALNTMYKNKSKKSGRVDVRNKLASSLTSETPPSISPTKTNIQKGAKTSKNTVKLGKTEKARTYTVKPSKSGILEVKASDGKPVTRTYDVLYKYADQVDLTEGEKYAPTSIYDTNNDGEAAEKSKNPSELAEIALRTKNQEYIDQNIDPTQRQIVEALQGRVKRSSFVENSDRNVIGRQMAKTYFRSADQPQTQPLDVIAQELSETTGSQVTEQDLVDLMLKYPNGVDTMEKEVRDMASNTAKQRFTELTGLPNSDRFLEKAVEQAIEKEQLVDNFERFGSLGIKTDQELLDLQREIEQTEQEIYGSEVQRGTEESPVSPSRTADESQPEVQGEDGGEISPTQQIDPSDEQSLDDFLDSLQEAATPLVDQHISVAYKSEMQLNDDVKTVEKDVKVVKLEPSGKKPKGPKPKVNNRIIDEFVETKTLDVVGKRIKNVQDVADLYLIHRSPRIEKGHIVFVRNGEIVHASSETLGLSYATTIAGNNASRVAEIASTLEADQVFAIHNHPSGNPEPSNADIAFTKNFGNGLPSTIDFQHVVINSNKFSLIDRQGEVKPMDYKKKPKPLFKKRISIGKDLTKLMDVGIQLSKGGAPHHVIYLSSDGHVNANEIIDGSERNLKNHIEGQMKNFGARNFVVVTDGSNVKVNSLRHKAIDGKLEFLEVKGNKAKYIGPGREKSRINKVSPDAVQVLFEDAPEYAPFPVEEESGFNETYVPKEVSDIARNAILAAGQDPNVTNKKQAIQKGNGAIEQTVFYNNLTPPERAYLRKNFVDVVFNGQPIAPRAENQRSGIKKDLVPTNKQAATTIDKRSMNDLLERGREIAESGQDMGQLVDELILRPRALQADETAALVYYKTTLDNQSFRVSEKLLKAYEKNDESRAAQLEYELRKIEKALEEYEEMSVETAYEQGLALYVRRMLLTNRYELAKQLSRAKATGGGKIPKYLENRLKDLSSQLKATEESVKKLEAEKAELENELIVTRNTEGSLTANEQKDLAAAISRVNARFTAQEIDVLKEDDTLDGDLELINNLLMKSATSLADYKEKARLMKVPGEAIAQLEKKFKAKGGKRSTGRTQQNVSQPYVDSAGILHIPNKYVKNVLELTGIDKVDELTQYVYDDIQSLGVEVTPRQVRDLITDYGKTVNMSQAEIDIRLRKLRRIGRLLSGQEDARIGKRPKRSGLQRDKPTPQERKMQRELKEMLKLIPVDEAEADRQWKSALDGVKTRLENQIVDLQEQIKNREKKKPNQPIELDQEAEGLKERVKVLQAELETIVGKPERSPEARVKAAIAQSQRTIEMYEKRIKERDFSSLDGDPIPLTPELKKKREQVKAVKKQYDDLREASETAEEKEAKAIEKKRKQLWSRYTKLKEKVDKGEIEYKQRKVNEITSPEIRKTQKLIDEKQAELDRMREAAGILERRKIENYRKNLERSIGHYKERIANKDYAPKKKPDKIAGIDEKIRRLEIDKAKWKFEFDKEQIKWQMANRSRTEKSIDLALDLMNMPRSFMASADLSAPLRQGFLLSVRNPRAAGRAFVQMLKAARSQKLNDDWLAQVQQSDEYVLMKDAKLYLSEPTAELSAREEQFTSRIANKLFWVPVSERAYSTFLNKLRVDVFNHMADKLEKKGYDPRTDKGLKAYKDAAKFINNASGRGDLGKIENWGPALSAMFFSPRYVVSRFNLLNPATYVKMEAPVRQEALKTVVSYVSFGLTVLALAAAAGAEVEEDPRSADFGKIKIGKKRYDIWAGWQQWARFIAQMITAQRKSSNTGEIIELDGKGPFGQSRGNVFFNFLRGKLAPVPSSAIDLMFTKDIVGNEVTLGQEVLQWVWPIYVNDMIEVWNDGEGFGEQLAVFIPNFFGIGVQRYGSKAGEEAKKDDKKKQVGSLK